MKICLNGLPLNILKLGILKPNALMQDKDRQLFYLVGCNNMHAQYPFPIQNIDIAIPSYFNPGFIIAPNVSV
jgi:hypothetical protein